MEYLIGIDLGGSSVKALAVTPDGERLTEAHREFDDLGEQEFADEIRSVIGFLEGQFDGEAKSIGLSAPGLVSADGLSIRNMPGRLSGLVGLNWTRFLSRSAPIPVLNDAQAALAGEAWVGAVREIPNVVFLTLGTGVGGAAKVDGQILRGALGRAGHLGHICLDPDGEPDICRTPGSLELAVGNCTIEQRTQGQFKTTHALVEAVRAGDSKAQSYWDRTIHHLACGLTSFINVLDPEVIVIGGGIARAGELLFSPLRERVAAMEWMITDEHVAIRPAELGEWAGAYGAAITGSRARESRP